MSILIQNQDLLIQVKTYLASQKSTFRAFPWDLKRVDGNDTSGELDIFVFDDPSPYTLPLYPHSVGQDSPTNLPGNYFMVFVVGTSPGVVTAYRPLDALLPGLGEGYFFSSTLTESELPRVLLETSRAALAHS